MPGGRTRQGRKSFKLIDKHHKSPFLNEVQGISIRKTTEQVVYLLVSLSPFMSVVDDVNLKSNYKAPSSEDD